MNELVLIQENDFHSAWSRLIKNILRVGTETVIGSKKEPKPIIEITAVTELIGNAITQIECGKLASQFPCQFAKPYMDEFTYEYQEEYIKDPSKQFVYTYMDRIVNYNVNGIPYDQLKSLWYCLHKQVESGISSNRCQAITWKVPQDTESDEPPCWQRVWLHHVGDNKVDVHLDWRSRDCYGAWQINLIAIINMLNLYVIKPNGCKIVRIIELIDSLHIYKNDLMGAEKVHLQQVNPQLRYR